VANRKKAQENTLTNLKQETAVALVKEIGFKVPSSAVQVNWGKAP